MTPSMAAETTTAARSQRLRAPASAETVAPLMAAPDWNPRSSPSAATTAPTQRPTWPAPSGCSTRQRADHPRTLHGKIEMEHILEAFLKGIDGILVAGCLEGGCHFLEGNLRARRRTDRIREMLAEIGVATRGSRW